MKKPLCSSYLFSLTAFFLSTFGTHCAFANSGVRESGGSDYLAFGLQPQRLESQRDWKQNELFKTPACSASSHISEMVSDLRSMYASGQRKIAVVLFHSHLDGDELCRGYLLNTADRSNFDKIKTNIQLLVKAAGVIGYDEVQVRFAPQWINNPKNWNSWRDDLFAENEEFVAEVGRAIVGLGGPRIVIDLGVELGGSDKPLVAQYMKRLWTSSQSWAANHTYGFSIAYAPGRLARYIENVRNSPGIPSEFALDIYKNPEGSVVSAAQEARSAGVTSPVFLIQETSYRDRQTYESFVRGANEAGVSIRAIMQWPKASGGTHRITEGSTYNYIYSPTH